MTRVTRLTHERLTELLDYSPVTGAFVWKVSTSNAIKVGERAGTVHEPSGARYITIDTERFMAHRLAWLYVNREWPAHDVRPDNGDFDDCRIENLKDVPRIQIAHRRTALSTNTSGYLGVSKSSKKGKWQATITWNYKQVGLGSNFPTPQDASEIYNAAAERLKGAATQEQVDLIVAELRLFRRQRAAWKHLQRTQQATSWAGFDEFAKDITEIPTSRYALSAIDVALPIGPGNFRWSLPIDAELNSSKDFKAYMKADRHHNQDRDRAKHLRKEYGADIAYERKLLVEQSGLCAICEKPEELTRGKNSRRLSLDHDHITKGLRGLLCGNCNMAVGYFCDDPTLMRKAAAYVERFRNPDATKVVSLMRDKTT